MGKHCKLCKIEAVKGEARSFHRFPDPQYQREAWCQVLNVELKVLKNWTFVCSDHFSPECFIYRSNGQRFLKDDAVPLPYKGPLKRIGRRKKGYKERNVIKSEVIIKTENENQERLNAELDRQIKVEQPDYLEENEDLFKQKFDLDIHVKTEVVTYKECDVSDLKSEDRIDTDEIDADSNTTSYQSKDIPEVSGSKYCLNQENSEQEKEDILPKLFKLAYPKFSPEGPYFCNECSFKSTFSQSLRKHFFGHRESEFRNEDFNPDDDGGTSFHFDSSSQFKGFETDENSEQENHINDLHVETITNENGTIAESSANKRKKKSRKPSLEEQESIRVQKQIEKYPLRPPCSNCRLKCTNKVSQVAREIIHLSVSKLTWFEKRTWIVHHVRPAEIATRRANEIIQKRQYNYKYFVPLEDNIELQVCKHFFLTTLGFKPNNDGVIRKARESVDLISMQPSEDKRGKSKNVQTVHRADLIRTHIESFNPCVSHYRRVHAPNRRYLPNEFTIVDMHRDFCEKNSASHISYEHYRSILSSMNISFTKLEHEECESCEKFSMHNPQHGKTKLDPVCVECTEWSSHEKNTQDARKMYTSHVEMSQIASADSAFYSADLQKVIMLPKMDNFKVVMFTRRIIAFNQSFVPLGTTKSRDKPIAVIWHEAISGRKKVQIVSAFHQFFKHNRDKKHIFLWLDSCSGQNRNWSLFSFLVYLINSDEVETDIIELNYFESGHTFMAADSFHHQVESSMNRMGKIYDFQDFETAVAKTNSGNVVTKSLRIDDFKDWPDYSSKAKLSTNSEIPLVRDLKKIQVKRGHFKLFYSVSYAESQSLKELDFLQDKILEHNFPPARTQMCPRGIPIAKKSNIIQNLVPLMPRSRRHFWQNLVTSNVYDLIDNVDDENTE